MRMTFCSVLSNLERSDSVLNKVRLIRFKDMFLRILNVIFKIVLSNKKISQKQTFLRSWNRITAAQDVGSVN